MTTVHVPFVQWSRRTANHALYLQEKLGMKKESKGNGAQVRDLSCQSNERANYTKICRKGSQTHLSFHVLGQERILKPSRVEPRHHRGYFMSMGHLMARCMSRCTNFGRY